MFRKLHLQLTLLFTAVTGIILFGMICLCLFISGRDAGKTAYANFRNNVSSIVAYLDSQTVLSHQWLLNAQQSYRMEIEITDNGSPLFFQSLEQKASSLDFKKAREYARDTLEYALAQPAPQSAPEHIEFPYSDGSRRKYYASVVQLPRPKGTLSMTVLFSLEPLAAQIRSQRISFALAGFLGLGLLAVFSYFYTKRLIRPLEKNQESQTAFIAAASHELRSPLAVLLSNLSALKQADESETDKFRRVMEEEGLRMSRLIEDMLSLANADNHSWNIQRAPAELDTLVLSCYEKYEIPARERGLLLSVELPAASVPPCICDASRIMQVLSILMDNALSYTPAPGRIRLSLAVKGDRRQITVADSGPGIPKEQRNRIFERFYRGDAAHKDREHFGLGLCIAKEILTLHRGDIQIKDAPEGGAAFVVTLRA